MKYLLVIALSGLIIAAGALAQAPPTPGNTPNCIAPSEIRVDAIVTPIMPDNDGDLWVHIRYRSTGKLLIGFMSRASGKFCLTGEGKTNPES